MVGCPLFSWNGYLFCFYPNLFYFFMNIPIFIKNAIKIFVYRLHIELLHLVEDLFDLVLIQHTFSPSTDGFKSGGVRSLLLLLLFTWVSSFIFSSDFIISVVQSKVFNRDYTFCLASYISSTEDSMMLDIIVQYGSVKLERNLFLHIHLSLIMTWLSGCDVQPFLFYVQVLKDYLNL